MAHITLVMLVINIHLRKTPNFSRKWERLAEHRSYLTQDSYNRWQTSFKLCLDWPISVIILVCGCVCVCAIHTLHLEHVCLCPRACVHVNVCIQRPEPTSHVSLPLTVISEPGAGLVNDLQGASSLCLPSAEIPSVYHYI